MKFSTRLLIISPLAIALAGCGKTQPLSYCQQHPLDASCWQIPTMPTTPAPNPGTYTTPTAPAQPAVAYPLGAAAAQDYLEIGFNVIGNAGSGREVILMKSSHNVYETKQVFKLVCSNDWGYNRDTMQYDYKYKCENKFVDERVPVKTTYYIRTGLWAFGEFDTAFQAINSTLQLGVKEFRLQ